MRDLIARICSLRPWSARELGTLLDREHRNLVGAHLTPMVKQGMLEYTQTGKSARNQAYRTA